MRDSIITLPVLKQVDHAIALIYQLSMSHNNRSPLRRKDRKKERKTSISIHTLPCGFGLIVAFQG